MSIGDEIKKRRAKQGLSLTELARLAGVSKGYVSEIESNPAARPSASTLFKIASALGASVGELLGSKPGGHDQESGLEIPDSLREFAKSEGLPDAEVRMLARIRYRGKAPRTAEDWRYIYESIRLRIERR
jgi:transcriptional regulator with XRE-family HTH domain